MVTVNVQDHKFYIHKNLLCNRSSYFRACFDGKFKEAEDNVFNLPDDDVEAFKLFVDWLYGAPVKKCGPEELASFLALLVFSEKICLEFLHNEIMNQIRAFYRTCDQDPPVSTRTIQYVYENTLSTSPLRYFIISLAAWTCVESVTTALTGIAYEELLRQGGDFAVDFSFSLALVHTPSGVSKDPRSVPSCTFHNHKTTPPCKGFTGAL